mmetsp:Transcript_122874/g.238989  ORF Transcript_122874/g.238989 Transcript_122874/m.238989 type:complete len:877 (+) Transcript_122874:42-2672(+)
MALEHQVGDRVQVTVTHIGTVKFVGTTDFAPSSWIGVELDDPVGKNDGSVRQKRYFQCEPSHGIFVQPDKVKSHRAKSYGHQLPSPSGAGGAPCLEAKVGRSMTDSMMRESCPAPCAEVQLKLAEAADNHDMESIRRFFPLAIQSRVPPRELENAWRTLDFEIESLCESECDLLREELQEAQLRTAHVEGMLKGDQERATVIHNQALAELSAEAAQASQLRTELSAALRTQSSNLILPNGSAAPQEAWLDAITRAVRDATMPLMDQVENKTNEVLQKVSRRNSHRILPLSDIDWRSEVDPPPQYLQDKYDVQDTCRRGITLSQLRCLGDLVQKVLDTMVIRDPHPDSNAKVITLGNVNLYHINDLFVVPLTTEAGCSFVELIANGPQDPDWFISHWWGCPFMESLSMLKFHAKAHHLPQDANYWMCTFANNQHHLEDLDEKDLMQTPFARAIMSDTCQGTIMLMNETAEPFKRTWCTLEIFISKKKQKAAHYKFEIAAIIQAGDQKEVNEHQREKIIPRSYALLMDDGNGNLEDHVEFEGAWFPGQIARLGVKVDISKADASNEEDKRSILRFISGANPNEELPAQHYKYDAVNHAIHSVFGPRALYDAAQDGNVDDVEAILDQAISEVDVRNARGETPLWTAAMHNRQEVVSLLLDKSADANILCGCGNTPVQAAVASEAIDALTVLLEAHADVDKSGEKGTPPIYLASQEGTVSVAKLLLQARAQPDSVWKEGNTPLHVSAKNDESEILLMLLEWRADPDKQNNDGNTALLLAAQDNCIVSLERLLTIGQANPNKGDNTEGTPLSWAVYHENKEAVISLLQSRADPNAVFTNGNSKETALDSAKTIENESSEIIRILRHAGGLFAEELENLGAE